MKLSIKPIHSKQYCC